MSANFYIITFLIVCLIALVGTVVMIGIILYRKQKLLNIEEELKIKENKLFEISKQLNETSNDLNNILANKQLETTNLEKLQIQVSSAKSGLKDLEEQAQGAADIFYEKTMALANQRISTDIDLEEKRYQEATEKYKQEYIKTVEEMGAEFAKLAESKQHDMIGIIEALHTYSDELADIKGKVEIAIQSKKIAEQEGLNKDFYRCIISNTDICEIDKLREIEPYFRNPRPICKIIWETYYKDNFSQLLARILPGKKNYCGIYKITNIQNEKIYIGQSVNVAERLKTHVKAGIGIDAPNLKMYIDMKKIGVENFSFELLEECPSTQLNEKEKYWIEFYHGQDYGYNSTKGGS